MINLYDTVLAGGYTPNAAHGAGILLNGGGEVTMYGGEICENTGYRAGGVYVNGGTAHFIMVDGKIHDNSISLDYGGGVYVNQGGLFEMKGGEIYNNTAQRGGGIFSAGNVSITGGKIYANTVSGDGSAIGLTDWGTAPTLTLKDVEITGNRTTNNDTTVATIHSLNNATCNIGGNLIVKNNFGSNNEENNFNSRILSQMNIVDALGENAEIVLPELGTSAAITGNQYTITSEDVGAFRVVTDTQFPYLSGDNKIKFFKAELDGGVFERNTEYLADERPTPVKAGYKFVNWYTDADCTTEATTIEAGSTYYAKWQARALTGVTVAPKADAKFVYGDALTPADFVVTEVYDNGETEVVDTASYTVSPDKLENVGSVDMTVTYNGNAYTCTITVDKAAQAAPDAPVLKDRTYTSITLEIVEGAEYSCNGGAWQTSPEFTDLTAGTSYTFQVRYAETDTHAASEPSQAAEFATLAQSSSGGGGGSSRNNSYAVSTPKADNGSVTVNNGSSAKKGDTVTITVKPDAGYEIDKVTVTDSKGNTITVTDKGDGKYSFTMPDSKVDVKATFVKAEVEPDQPSKTTFVDVPENSWYADAADFVAQRGLMSGVGEKLFGGSQNTTRAMLMTILARMDGQDVTGGSTWYEKAMVWAKNNGVSDGTMPEVNITREQLATMLYSYAKLKGLDTPQGGMAVREFSDYDSISAWAGQSMTWAVNAGILSGRGNNTLAPTAGATRAEMAVMLQQFVKLMEK